MIKTFTFPAHGLAQARQEGEGGVELGEWNQLLLHLALHVRLPLPCQGLKITLHVNA